jgi:uncharacterized protein
MQLAGALMPVRAHWLRATALAMVVLVWAAIAGIGGAFAADPVFPALTGQVVDNANLLTVQQEASLSISLAALETKDSDQVVVVTVTSLQGLEIEDFANRLFRHWQIGQKTKNNGVLLVVAPKERKVRIEVGYGLEGTLTDGQSSDIVQKTILPQFRRGDFGGGIMAGVKEIEAVLLEDPAEVAKRAKGGGRSNSTSDWTDYLPLLFWLAIVIFIVWSNYRSMRQGLKTPGSRRRGPGVIIIPGGYGGSGSWGSSGGGGWSSGGGGFGGGGGSSGGGGASGGW